MAIMVVAAEWAVTAGASWLWMVAKPEENVPEDVTVILYWKW